MIYETAYVLGADVSEEASKKVADVVAQSITEAGGEVLLTDDWGVKTFAQPTKKGVTRGKYVYVIYKSDAAANLELERRFRISEDVLKFIFVNLGEDADGEAIVKAYKNPNHQTTSQDGVDPIKEKKMFQKKKSCYFSAKKTAPDWKDTTSYSWLVNDFGKISPARVTGLRPKYQRMANAAIKRGRCMGLISYMSSNTAR